MKDRPVANNQWKKSVLQLSSPAIWGVLKDSKFKWVINVKASASNVLRYNTNFTVIEPNNKATAS